MNKIGFKNFRRFQDFPPIEYDGITFLVGRNNSGKTTLAKALLLIDSYFKSKDIYHLSFGNNVLEDANVVTYDRAINNNATENSIQFYQEIERYSLELLVTGEADKTIANVMRLKITDYDYDFSFIFDFLSKTIKIIAVKDIHAPLANDKLVEDIEKQIRETKSSISSLKNKKTSKEYIELVSKYESLNNKLLTLTKLDINKSNKSIYFELESEFGAEYTVESVTNQPFAMPISQNEIDYNLKLHGIVYKLLDASRKQYEIEYNSIQQGLEPSDNFENLRALKETGDIFVESSLSHFLTLASDYSIAYLGANPSKQSALFAIRDRNNALAQAIHEFKQLNILPGEKEYRFVEKWMKEFDVGDSFEITMHAGEAYEMRIITGKEKVHLADKGMGSIQAMLLIMKIAAIIRKVDLIEKDPSQYRLISSMTLIIEEPELNLHPALQSKLADLFLEAHLTHKLNFLVETHSEYAIRRSQVLVAEREYEVLPNENPFFVYYFPSEKDELPYKMEYDADGIFKQIFGKGFFDEASLSTLELLKLKRQKKD